MKWGDYGKKRLKNIITDAIHTNESNIGWIKAVEEGYNYKVWKNGRVAKGRTRAWHKQKLIQAVPIDETFDIYGSYPAHMMYPGDLNGGAENVANCRCWLYYTNNVPSNLRKKTSFNVSPTFQQIWEKARQPTNKIKTTINKTINKLTKKNSKKKNTFFKKQFKLNSNKQSKQKSIVRNIKLFLKKMDYGWLPHTETYNNIKIIKRQNVNFIKMKEIEKLIDNLPPILLENVETIKIYGFPLIDNSTKKQILGRVKSETPQMAEIFETSTPQNTIVHELAHILDNFFANTNGFISGNPIWDEAYKLDKKHIKELESKEFVDGEFDYYVSEQSVTHANMMKELGYENIYGEDFAESVMRYLDPKDVEFNKLFPNRCKILKFILGE